jgi:hypothetical protein
MCATNLWPAVLCLIAGHALVALLARLDAWRETNRRRSLMDQALTRYEQSQHFWRPSLDVERRED